MTFNRFIPGIVVNKKLEEKDSYWDTMRIRNVSTVNIVRNRSGRRFAVFSCSIYSAESVYLFYAPITAAAWKRIGYDVVVILTGDFNLQHEERSRLNLTQQLLQNMGVSILYVQCNASYAVKISQLVRVFVGLLPKQLVHDNDDIITTDADLIPINRNQYQPTLNSDGFLINPYCCGLFKHREKVYRMFPMSHIFLNKSTWRALLTESIQRTELLATNASSDLLSNDALLSFDTITLYVRPEFKDVYDKEMIKGDAAWYMDQIFCSMLLIDYHRKHPNLIIHERNLTERLDRILGLQYWNRTDFQQFGDGHLPHNEIFLHTNWNILKKLLNFLFSHTQIAIFDKYYKEYAIKIQ